ncbi:MAG: signal peptidase I [Oscillospiraceae bacterium]|nr:signal peptidase I [Oscillospiraceae bacterium]
MSGTINVGDIVIVRRLTDEEKNELEKGEILVFYYEDRVIVHRLIRILEVNDERFFYTKGDNNATEDGSPIPAYDVIGVTRFRIPVLGYPTVMLNRMMR